MKIEGGCHCKAVRFEAEVPEAVEVLDCNCSICAATGFRHLIVPHGDFRLLSRRGRADLLPLRHRRGEPSVLRDLRGEELLPAALAPRGVEREPQRARRCLGAGGHRHRVRRPQLGAGARPRSTDALAPARVRGLSRGQRGGEDGDRIAPKRARTSAAKTRLVIGASSVGTVFEWYDFFIWGTLTTSGILQRSFFPPGDELLATLLAWATFAVGFAFRPLGAILFGYLGDKLGRKYTFLVTITLMGVATAGDRPDPELCGDRRRRAAADHPAAHRPGAGARRRIWRRGDLRRRAFAAGQGGFYTSFIQASVVGGFILSLAVVLGFKAMVSAEAWLAWGWRLPFLFSILLLAVSLWMRLKLNESPVFKAMKESGGLRAESVQGELHLSGQPQAAVRRLVRNRRRADRDLVHGDVLGARLPAEADAGRSDRGAADRRRRRRCSASSSTSLTGGAVRPGRAQEADRDRLCADPAAALPAVLGDRLRGGQRRRRAAGRRASCPMPAASR